MEKVDRIALISLSSQLGTDVAMETRQAAPRVWLARGQLCRVSPSVRGISSSGTVPRLPSQQMVNPSKRIRRRKRHYFRLCAHTQREGGNGSDRRAIFKKPFDCKGCQRPPSQVRGPSLFSVPHKHILSTA